MIWHVFDIPYELSEQLWSLSNDVLYVLGDFATHGQKDIRVFLKFTCQGADFFLDQIRFLVSPFDLAQI